MVNGWQGWTLALDAATYQGSVAVLRDGRVVARRAAAMRGETEERLMPAVLAALTDAGTSVRDVARVVCGEGPGSFTSLRIAASIAKGIALGNGVPLFAASSLALVVAGATDLAPGDYLAVLDALRGERFVAVVRRSPLGDVAVHGEARRIPAAGLAEEAARLGLTPIGPAEALCATPLAHGIAAMLDSIAAAGPVSLDAWEPAYGRLAEAQVKWEAAHRRPLPT
jgi:tRNA threonylcarbamoyladenosine biosynthesis protein TsaB